MTEQLMREPDLEIACAIESALKKIPLEAIAFDKYATAESADAQVGECAFRCRGKERRGANADARARDKWCAIA